MLLIDEMSAPVEHPGGNDTGSSRAGWEQITKWNTMEKLQQIDYTYERCPKNMVVILACIRITTETLNDKPAWSDQHIVPSDHTYAVSNSSAKKSKTMTAKVLCNHNNN